MNLFHLFSNSVKEYRNNSAIYADGKRYTYEQLSVEAARITHFLTNHPSQQIGIYGARSLVEYAGFLGGLAAGKTFVGFNPKSTHLRNLLILEESEATVLIIDQHGLEKIKREKLDFPPHILLIFPGHTADEIPDRLKTTFDFRTKEDLTEKSTEIKEVDSDHPAYILFTSGSTGKPKGVPVSHGNLISFFEYLEPLYDFNADDRFSQTYDLSFDPSFQNMFLCWGKGASLFIIPESSLLAPAKFIEENRITVWDSVPSIIQFMSKFRMLQENRFPHLKYSFLGGEALPLEVVLDWKKAAPNSVIENHYGPTETTIGIVKYRVPEKESDILSHHGVVSIGKVFKTHEYCLLDEDGKVAADQGELCLCGPQVTAGYWKDSENTKEHYIQLGEDFRIWYKTGDFLRKKDDHLFFIERLDHQVKIRGYRVELDEINLHLKRLTGIDQVYSLAHPIKHGKADNIYSFIEKSGLEIDKEHVFSGLNEKLPPYMIPKKIIFVEKLPVNLNGKVAIQQLIKLIS